MSAMALWAVVLVFVAGAVVLATAGVVLARAGDEIAARTSLTGLLVGMFLVSLATSLPEVVTDVSAAAARVPNIAVGDLFGSSMTNMAILAVLDLLRRRRVWPQVRLGQARIAAIAILLTSFAVIAIVSARDLAVGWVGVNTILIALAYLGALRWIRRSPVGGRETPAEVLGPMPPTPEERREPLRRPVLRFLAATAVIGVAAPVVALSAKQIAADTGLGQTFVGVALVAITTSMPELVVSLAALRLGALDLAVGNLFGSNAFNMVVLVIADVAYRPGPILQAVDPTQALAGMAAIGLMAIALAAIVHGEETRIGRLEPDALLLLIAYVLSLVLIGLAGG